jgi:uncharacterized hydrophobic protein (TIGR00341 family)
LRASGPRFRGAQSTGTIPRVLRVVAIAVAETDAQALRSLLQDQHLVCNWQHDLLGDLLLVHVVLKTDEAEALLDLLEQRFGHDADFRAVVLRVHATVPAIAEEPREKPPGRVARAEIQNELATGIDVGPVFLSTVVLSAVIAAVGLMRGNVAVIIGAMVVAPLLTPMMALAFAVTVGDLQFGRKALKAAAIGASLGFLFAVLLGFGYGEEPGAEILNRTVPHWSDLVLALASGAAGALAFTSGVSASLVGVMVAVALLPPVIVAGLLTARGDWGGAGGALTLLAINAISVVLAGVLTFAGRGLRPRTWWEKEKARRYFRRSVALGVALAFALLALVLLEWGIR